MIHSILYYQIFILIFTYMRLVIIICIFKEKIKVFAVVFKKL